MIPKLIKGRGIKGVAQYVLHDKRDARQEPDGPARAGDRQFPAQEANPVRGPDHYAKLRETYGAALRIETYLDQLEKERAELSGRVGFTTTRNLPSDDPHMAWRMMCETAARQDELKQHAGIKLGGRPTENFVGHLSLSWHPDEKPDQADMERAADSVLKAMGWDKLEAMIVEHTDEPHKHIHIVVCLIDPETGRAAPNRKDDFARVLQPWAYAYEKEQGLVRCTDREAAIEAARDQDTTRVQNGKVHRKDWEHQKAVERANAQAERVPANDDAPSQSLAQRQKAERDALYLKAKEQAKELARETRETFKPDWARLYRDHERETKDLKAILKGSERGAQLARFINEHRDTLLKGFKDLETANQQWPSLMTPEGIKHALEAGQKVETKALSDRTNAARQTAQRTFWEQYGAEIGALRQAQAQERAVARQIDKEQADRQAAREAAARQSKPLPDPSASELTKPSREPVRTPEIDRAAASQRALEQARAQAARATAEQVQRDRPAITPPPQQPKPFAAPQPTPRPSFASIVPAYGRMTVTYRQAAPTPTRPAEPQHVPETHAREEAERISRHQAKTETRRADEELAAAKAAARKMAEDAQEERQRAPRGWDRERER